jgi:predicted ribosome quality control (RQC) complex YloA/Tae2 family protein
VSHTTWISNVYGVTTITGGNLPVMVSPYSQLGTTASARRFKKDIETMDRASEAILALKPVTFHYKNDTKGVPQFGLVAEDVAKVNPDLVVNDRDDKPYTVRYEAVNAMLLNEFLKEHRKVQELTKDFQATVAQLTARLDEQAAQIQRVSAQLEASKPAAQMVNNNQ